MKLRRSTRCDQTGHRLARAPGARRGLRRAPGATSRDRARGAGGVAGDLRGLRRERSCATARVAPGQSVLAALQGVAKVSTRYGGRFVQSIDGKSGLARRRRGLAVLRERRRGRRRRSRVDAPRRRHRVVGLPPLARVRERAGGGRLVARAVRARRPHGTRQRRRRSATRRGAAGGRGEGRHRRIGVPGAGRCGERSARPRRRLGPRRRGPARERAHGLDRGRRRAAAGMRPPARTSRCPRVARWPPPPPRATGAWCSP